MLVITWKCGKRIISEEFEDFNATKIVASIEDFEIPHNCHAGHNDITELVYLNTWWRSIGSIREKMRSQFKVRKTSWLLYLPLF